MLVALTDNWGCSTSIFFNFLATFTGAVCGFEAASGGDISDPNDSPFSHSTITYILLVAFTIF